MKGYVVPKPWVLNLLANIVIVAGIIVILFGAYCGIIMIYPKKIVVFDYKKIPVMKQQVYQGEVLPTHLKYHRFVSGLTIVHRRFTNGGDFPGRNYEIYREKGDYDYIGYDVIIPEHLPPGKYYFTNEYDIPVNWLRTYHFRMESEPFEVLGIVKPHDDAEDEALIRKVLRGMRAKGEIGLQGKTGEIGPKGERGEQGKRGPGLFGK